MRFPVMHCMSSNVGVVWEIFKFNEATRFTLVY